MADQIKQIGIYINLQKPESRNLAEDCIKTLQEFGFSVCLLKGQIGCEDQKVIIYDKDQFFKKPDCILVLGGDGTLLYVARQTCFNKIPIFGINLGKLGFLTESEASSYKNALNQLNNGNYYIEERMMLGCMVRSNGILSKKYVALNDVLVKSRGFRMMDIQAYASGSKIDAFRADGLVISTPTGSTGYSLAAGGPVVSPRAGVMVLNPICPHRLHDRSYVLSEDEKITLKFGNRENDIMLTLDGQTTLSLIPEDEVEVFKSVHTTRLIRLNQIGYFDRLRIKLSSGN
ncbi:NAD(+)/NADH kinase [Eubacteriaceae bacterium ES3]|nr:NAD(+)/NADH kinase [Eubacteriaceae bacterium ES3]